MKMKHFVTVHVCDFETMGTVMKTLERDNRITVVDYGPIPGTSIRRSKHSYTRKREAGRTTLQAVVNYFKGLNGTGVTYRDVIQAMPDLNKNTVSARISEARSLGFVDLNEGLYSPTAKCRAVAIQDVQK